MWLLSLFLLVQPPSDYAILAAEHSRSEDVSILQGALESSEPQRQRLAIRAFGRLERPALAVAVIRFLRSADRELRREAVGALAQMAAPFDFSALLPSERAGEVRAIIYEAIGRSKPKAEAAEALLVAGLRDDDVGARTGAARGLEALVRLNLRTARPAAPTLEALRLAVSQNSVSRLRQFALLALNAVGGGNEPTFDAAFKDPDPQVRRLAVIGSKRFVEDPSPIVRLEALRQGGNCARALTAVRDVSGHVALAAVDLLGALKCDATEIERLADRGTSWRVRARALVSLAKVAPESARKRVKTLARDPLWQVRAYAASAAKLLIDQATLDRLASDRNPNVAAAALTTALQAIRALASDHSGLLLVAADRLKGTEEVKGATPLILAAIQRLSRTGRATSRDPRLRLVDLLGEAGDAAVLDKLRPLLSDRDPEVAARVAKVLTERTGLATTPLTTRYVPEPFPAEATLRSLESTRAVFQMKGLGTFTVQLLPEEAPVTVANFAALAERGSYNGLTFHRVVPNFVLQGGSPGANEYDALTSQFMRDELGLTSNERGTLGTSTRGHDTGDGQIFINLIDNWRLDHTYTVFARVILGLEVVDQILEGDVIESVRIVRGRPVV